VIHIRSALPDELEQLESFRRHALANSPVELTGEIGDHGTQLQRPSTATLRDASASAFGLSIEAVSFVAIEDGRWLGLVDAKRECAQADLPPDIRLSSLWVEPAARRRGVGRALALKVLDWARAAGSAAVVLEVQALNANALGLYRSLGFSEGPSKGRAGPWLRMTAALNPEPPA
jgi:ribosomal protein S18 acetylase RimI-like enzyme